MEEVDLREEGEVESDNEPNVYKTIDRPQQNFRPQAKLLDSDSQSSDEDQIGDSDDEGIKMKPKIRNKVNKPSIHQRVNPPSKSGNMWRSMLQEECLTENLQTFDVTRKRKHERGAESYDYETHRANPEMLTNKRKKFEPSSNDSSSSNHSNKSREKRKIKKAKHKNRKNHPLQTPKILPNIIISFNVSDEEYGQMLAKNLEEEKSDLIVRVVSVIGKDESLKLYTNTQNIEKKGGLMTINKDRRRTPGGIFLWLLKTSNKIDDKKKKEIFDVDDKEKQMSDGNWLPAKTDPPPPSPIEETSTNSNPDPQLVSQKILSSIPAAADDVLELDYNEDMDTF